MAAEDTEKVTEMIGRMDKQLELLSEMIRQVKAEDIAPVAQEAIDNRVPSLSVHMGCRSADEFNPVIVHYLAEAHAALLDRRGYLTRLRNWERDMVERRAAYRSGRV
ncbi:MAG: hypothetical protein ABW022_15700 [Actinoplanes sp.]